MAGFIGFSCMRAVVIASIVIAGMAEQNSTAEQEQITDRADGTDIYVGVSPNIVHWIFVPALMAVALIGGCAVFSWAVQKARAALTSERGGLDIKKPQVEIDIESLEIETLPSDTSFMDGKECPQTLSDGLAVTVLSGDGVFTKFTSSSVRVVDSSANSVLAGVAQISLQDGGDQDDQF